MILGSALALPLVVFPNSSPKCAEFQQSCFTQSWTFSSARVQGDLQLATACVEGAFQGVVDNLIAYMSSIQQTLPAMLTYLQATSQGLVDTMKAYMDGQLTIELTWRRTTSRGLGDNITAYTSDQAHNTHMNGQPFMQACLQCMREYLASLIYELMKVTSIFSNWQHSSTSIVSAMSWKNTTLEISKCNESVCHYNATPISNSTRTQLKDVQR